MVSCLESTCSPQSAECTANARSDSLKPCQQSQQDVVIGSGISGRVKRLWPPLGLDFALVPIWNDLPIFWFSNGSALFTYGRSLYKGRAALLYEEQNSRPGYSSWLLASFSVSKLSSISMMFSLCSSLMISISRRRFSRSFSLRPSLGINFRATTWLKQKSLVIVGP